MVGRFLHSTQRGPFFAGHMSIDAAAEQPRGVRKACPSMLGWRICGALIEAFLIDPLETAVGTLVEGQRPVIAEGQGKDGIEGRMALVMAVKRSLSGKEGK